MWKRLWKISNLKYVAAFLIPAIFVMLLGRGLDNDSWFVLAEGRYLIENGIHYTDVLTMHEDLNIVVQNYGFAAIFYWIHSILGASGLYAVMLVLNLAVCYLFYKICMILSDRNVNLSLLIMIVMDLLLSWGFVVTRAQMVSYVIFLALIYVLELYIKTDKVKYLGWVPLLSLLQINLHASLWWMLILVMMVYVVDSIKKPRLHLQGYRTKPLLVVGFVAMLMGLINPYGIKMVTYIFTSYGASDILALVNEMEPFNLMSSFNVILYFALTIVLVLCIFGDKRLVRIRYLLMFFGFLALGLNTIKGMSQFILVMFLPLVVMYKNKRVEGVIEAKIGRDAVVFWTGVVAMVIFIAQCIVVIPQTRNNPSDDVVESVDALVEKGADENSKVYVGYNNGGYVEYRGLQAYIDPRAEVFLKKNNGREDILREWEDMLDGKIESDEFLDKYNFDYLIVEKKYERGIYKMDREDYRVIYENEDEEIKVYEHINVKEE